MFRWTQTHNDDYDETFQLWLSSIASFLLYCWVDQPPLFKVKLAKFYFLLFPMDNKKRLSSGKTSGKKVSTDFQIATLICGLIFVNNYLCNLICIDLVRMLIEMPQNIENTIFHSTSILKNIRFWFLIQ